MNGARSTLLSCGGVRLGAKDFPRHVGAQLFTAHLSSRHALDLGAVLGRNATARLLPLANGRFGDAEAVGKGLL